MSNTILISVEGIHKPQCRLFPQARTLATKSQQEPGSHLCQVGRGGILCSEASRCFSRSSCLEELLRPLWNVGRSLNCLCNCSWPNLQLVAHFLPHPFQTRSSPLLWHRRPALSLAMDQVSRGMCAAQLLSWSASTRSPVKGTTCLCSLTQSHLPYTSTPEVYSLERIYSRLYLAFCPEKKIIWSRLPPTP